MDRKQLLSNTSLQLLGQPAMLASEVPDMSADSTSVLRRLFERYCKVRRDVENNAKVVHEQCSASKFKIEGGQFVDSSIVQAGNRLPKCFKLLASYGDKVVVCKVKTVHRHRPADFHLLLHQLLTVLWLYSSTEDNLVEVSLFMTDAKKVFPVNARVPLGPVNVNSGVTFIDDDNDSNPVLCVRSEEHVKVLVHELVHSLRLDMQNFTAKDVIPLYHAFNIDRDGCQQRCRTVLRPNEAYVECIANILNVFHIAFCTRQDVHALLNLERKFAVLQAGRVLQHYGYDDAQSILREGPGGDDHPLKLRQSTSVFSYYILRAALLYAFDEFMTFAKSAPRFPRPSEPSKFISLALSCASAKAFLKCVNEVMRQPRTTQTLRMTVLETAD